MDNWFTDLFDNSIELPTIFVVFFLSLTIVGWWLFLSSDIRNTELVRKYQQSDTAVHKVVVFYGHLP